MRITENDEIVYQVLKVLDETATPIGAGSIRKNLLPDYRVSMASVGIILRDLQERGLVIREGFRGHVVSVKGRDFLMAYRNRQKNACLADRIFEYLTGNERQRLENILEARRAVETEVARLAAKRANDADIAQLSRNTGELMKARGGREKARLDREFHALLLDSAKNPLLNTLFDFSEQVTAASDGASLEQFLAAVREKIGSTLCKDHSDILKAIMNKDGAGAEKAMAAHIDRILYLLENPLGRPPEKEDPHLVP